MEADLAGFYDVLTAGGYQYGPAFRGLRAAWKRGTEVFAEIALPEPTAAGAAAYGLHPALLDAALHASALAVDAAGDSGKIRLPFSWTDVTVHTAGARALRVRLTRDPSGALSLEAADASGAPVVSAASLIMRPVSARLLAPASRLNDALFTVEWIPVPASAGQRGRRQPAGLRGGRARDGVPRGRTGRGRSRRCGVSGSACPGRRGPGRTPGAGRGAGPGRPGRPEDGGDLAAAARRVAGHVLGLVQQWLELAELAPARLVIVTRGAVAAVGGEGVADLAGAAAWGLARSAQSENPDRIVLADLPAAAAGDAAAAAAAVAVLARALDAGEPEIAVRGGQSFTRRLARPADDLTAPGDGAPWRLTASELGTLDGLSLAPAVDAADPLAEGQARIAVRAAGLNFRDVLIGLGMYPGGGVPGSEVAGVVLEAGPGVTSIAVGDRVLGLAVGGFGPVVVADARQLVPLPADWSFAAGAAVPVAFSTAWYALVDLIAAQPGQRVLVHAGTGGFGMAAIAVARHLGLEVFATASRAKWGVLAGLGLDAEHIASSRDAGFEAAFLAATDGAGMDIVLNSLVGELIDASLRLLPRGGAFLETGPDRPAGPGADRRRPPGRDLPAVHHRRGPAGAPAADPGRGDQAAGRGSAGPAAGARLGRAPGPGRLPLHEPGPAHRQDRADHPVRPRRPGGSRDGARHRRDRDAGRPGRAAPGGVGSGRAAGAAVPVRSAGGGGRAGRGGGSRGGRGGVGHRRRRGQPRLTGRGAGRNSRRGAADRRDPRGGGAGRRGGAVADGGAGRRGDAAEGGRGLAPPRADGGHRVA